MSDNRKNDSDPLNVDTTRTKDDTKHSIESSHQIEVVISLILPVYNEENTIEDCVIDAMDVLPSLDIPYEIVVVDDGSTDGTESVLHDLRSKYPNTLRVARHLQNKGKGSALRSGIRVSNGEIVVFMDTDGQHSAMDIPNLLSQIPPYDMVVGVRSKDYQGSWYRNLANRFYNNFASWLTQYPIQDLTSGFRVMRRSCVMHFLPIFPARFSSETTITLAFLKSGYNVAYVPVDVNPRIEGKSKINPLMDGTRFLMIMLRMIILYDPLRIFLPITGFLLFMGVMTMIVGIWAASRLVVPGSSIVLFIAAVLVFLLGLLSSQLSNLIIAYHGDEFIYIYE